MRLILTSYRTSTAPIETHLLCRPRAMVRKMAGFSFSSYRLLGSNSPVLLTMDNYLRMMQLIASLNEQQSATYNTTVRALFAHPSGPFTLWHFHVQLVTTRDIPKQRVMVMMQPNMGSRDREYIINSLKNFVTNDLTFVTDTPGTVDSTKTATDLMNLFFNIGMR